jgi:LysR family glycine cleavage system transcriptional activator
VTPSTISHQIQKLEDWMGVQLFKRLNRKVILTDAGRTYFFTISKAFDEMSTVTDLVSQRHVSKASRKTLKLFADAGFIECWLGPRLEKLQSVLPDVQLDIAYGQDIEDYIRGDADVAIHFGKGTWPEYQSVLLRTGHEFPVCSPKLLEGGATLAAPSDLSAFTLLHESDTSGWTNWLARAHVSHPGLMNGAIFHSTQAIFNKVIACQGIALGDDIVAADMLLAGDLIKPIGKVRKSSQSLYYLQMKYSDDNETCEVFRTWLLDELSEHRRQTAMLRTDEPFSFVPPDR